MLEKINSPHFLKKSLENGGDFAELFYENTRKTILIYENNCLENASSGTDQGIGLRVLDGHNTLYGFTNQIEKNALEKLTSHVRAGVKSHGSDKKIQLKKQEAKTVFLIKEDPNSVSFQTKAQLLAHTNSLARGLDARIKQVRLTYRETQRQVQIANTEGTLVNSIRTITDLIVSLTASEGHELASSIDVISGHGGFELLDEQTIELAVRDAARRVLQNLTAIQAPGGRMPVVISSRAGGTLIHEAVGHGLEADLIADELSVFRDKRGKAVASKLITVVDDATLLGKRGSFSFDDEGTLSQRTTLIENGILKNYMTDRLSALKLGLPLTGNGRRESYEYRPIVRMTNTLLCPGNDHPEEILQSTKTGLFVAKMGGGQVNTVNGDFVFEVTEAYLIENGKLGSPVKNATLTGNTLDVLKSIDKVGNDLGFSSGTCGKDSQDAPVTDALPTIRIPELVVGGKVL